MKLGSVTAAGAGGCAGRGRQGSGSSGKAEHRAPSCQGSGAEANLCAVLASFVITLRQ